MGFNQRHEQQLAEIRSLLDGLDRGSRESAERLGIAAGKPRRCAARGAPKPPPPNPLVAKPGALAGRVRGRVRRAVYGPDIELPQGPARGGEADAGHNGSADADDPLIAFVHIPKTAGGTVAAMFVSAYSNAGLHKAGNYMSGPENSVRKLTRSPREWAAWQRRGGKVTLGHVPYAVLREHVPANTRYITFLREPVDRVVSHYHRHIHRRNPRLAGSPKEIAKGRVKADSLEEALTELGPPQLSNLQTRFLSDSPVLGDLPASALDEAKANLRSFAFVGIQERFAESIERLEELLGLEGAEYEDRHVSADRPAVEEIPAEVQNLIVEHNKLDIELYEFAVELFDDTAGEPAQ